MALASAGSGSEKRRVAYFYDGEIFSAMKDFDATLSTQQSVRKGLLSHGATAKHTATEQAAEQVSAADAYAYVSYW